VTAALETGARYGELANLKVRDFSADAGTLAVATSKSGKPRHIVLTDSGVKYFKQLCAGRVPACKGRKEDFLAVIDGMEMDAAEDIRAPEWARLDLYCDRVASAVGRLSVRVFGMEREAGVALAQQSEALAVGVWSFREFVGRERGEPGLGDAACGAHGGDTVRFACIPTLLGSAIVALLSGTFIVRGFGRGRCGTIERDLPTVR
jgi:hypothetical protein